MCYIPGSSFLALILAWLAWLARGFFESVWHVFVTATSIGVQAGITAAFATTLMIAASAAAYFIAWTARLTRAYMGRRGACTTCAHPCIEALGDHGTGSVGAEPVSLTDLPWPGGRPGALPAHLDTPAPGVRARLRALAPDMIIRAGARPAVQRPARAGSVSRGGTPRSAPLTLASDTPADTRLTLPVVSDGARAGQAGIPPVDTRGTAATPDTSGVSGA